MPDLPRHITTLSVSWFNNQVRAIAVHRGKIAGSCECTGAYEGPEHFTNLVADLVARTGYEGQTVSLVLAHPRLVQQLVEVPPVKGAALQRVIHRQAQKQTMFAGEAAYASQFLVSSKRNSNVLLHLFPKLVLNQFTVGCRRNGLHLTSVLPASAVLQRQLASLNLQRGDIVALAAETGGTTTVIVADSDGRLFLARTLPDNWNTAPDRLAVDLNRTLLYVSQQFQVNVNRGLYLFGLGAVEQTSNLQRLIQAPVQVSPVPFDPFFYPTEGLKVRTDTAPNFLSPEMQKAPQRRVFAKVVAAAAGFLLAGSIGLTAYSLLQGKREKAVIAQFSQQLSQMEKRQGELMLLDTELKRKQQAIQLVLGERPPPTPAWLLAYLGQTVPADLVVTNFTVKREADYYRVTIAGTGQQALKSPYLKPLSESIAAFKQQLASSPFHLRLIETNASGEIVSQPKAGAVLRNIAARVPLSDWLSRVSSSVKPKTDEPAKVQDVHSFYIEGVMR